LAYTEKREQALQLLQQGFSQADVAKQLSISTRTLRNWKSGK